VNEQNDEAVPAFRDKPKVEEKLIVMQENLGLEHRGEILITTQERVDTNQKPIARDVVNSDIAFKLTERYNEHRSVTVPVFKDKPKPSVDAYTALLMFLEESKSVFDFAICAIPTGEPRNQLTELNMKRMQFIAEGNAAALHSIRLHTVLDKIVIAEEALAEMSSDDSRLGDARYGRERLDEELMKIMQE